MTSGLIYIAFGSNLATTDFPEPLETVKSAIKRVGSGALSLDASGRFYETKPVPVSDQAWYINTVCAFGTDLDAFETLALCHRIEAEMGRERSVPNAARVIDIDLVDFAGQVIDPDGDRLLQVPHPRIHQRAFVLRPLADIAPGWQHPVSGVSIGRLIADLPDDQALGTGIRLLTSR